ncbi:hypothetical protein DP149_04970 [Clostridium tetani]|uniref:hypothetical protein n=1 Tax=Clostridium tetani TaxID=1513 RepID=UPI0002E66C50|nr:hypothetical protein [Clostridium tetani]AVP54336.1 hypothetical protein C3B72_04030 [Clostridium tetani]KGI37095.1 hypothetical protein KY52_12350 [Clostridium tetani]KGI40486.1 hypothetical protein LA33_07535 [Clostridium tetani ATCC 9441]KGI46226.1 hypothetical protein KY54_01100 [Clostridium tetani]KHO36345.1 hypothetical protein OR63_04360 [Clostridium tetani]
MKLKTLLFSGMIATMMATPVLAMGSGHSYFTERYNGDDTMCSQDNGPEHSVKIRITHNTSANQTYALAACGCYGYSVGSKIKLPGGEGREVHDKHYAQTTSVCAPGNLTATEIHRVDYKLKK